jgi:1-deoxy-D-xylulose-5-phosphate synthase
VSLLASIKSPADVKRLDAEALPALADEIRTFLVDAVCRTGGHLGPNLGTVELTLALHRVFDSPHDVLLWDTGHQAYVHKIITGRQDQFDELRQFGGLSGYPNRAESEHDHVENSHASTALSYADGLSRAFRLSGDDDRHVVAIVGDGALTGGMCWEALNNIAADEDRPLVIVVNDNGRSYAPTVGGLAKHLSVVRLQPRYDRALDAIKANLQRTPLVGQALFDALHAVKKGLKDMLQPQILFEDLGLKYVGPIDGHDTAALELALTRARDYGRAVIVHTVTVKGNGYAPAEEDEADAMHGVGVTDPLTGKPVSSRSTWTHVFGEEMLAIGAEREDVVAITAAMLRPVGLEQFAAAYPDRVLDVGIAEQHAVTAAAGLALGGLKPVVALYATFLNRAFDQVLMDVALHKLPVTFVLDRAGVTGEDGPSHNGMWDLSTMQVVPGLRIAAPRDATQLRALLREAMAVRDAPTVVRFPKAAVGDDVVAVRSDAGVDVLRSDDEPVVLIVAVGALAPLALSVAERIAMHGIGATVVDPRWIKPVPETLTSLAAAHELVVTIEDNGRVGGFGAAVTMALADAGVRTPVRVFGLPQEFLPQGSRAQILAHAGLTDQEIGRRIVEAIARQDAGTVMGAPHESPAS